MVQIIPAVLAKTEQDYQNNINKLNQSESLSGGWVHIDFADNKFVQNTTIEPSIIQKYPNNFRKEAHLMVNHPKDWIDQLKEAGFERIIFHLESEDDILLVIEDIKNKGLEVGLAINKETALEKLEPFLDKIDLVLVMSIVPGFQGQPFIPQTLDKVRQIKSNNWSVKVGVDGAVRDTNIKEIVESGVDFITVGSYLLKGDVEENLEMLWEVLN